VGRDACGHLLEKGRRKRIVGDNIARVKRTQNLHLQVKGQRAEEPPKGHLVPQLHAVSPTMVIHPVDMVYPAKNARVGKANTNQPLFLLGNRNLSVIVVGVLPHVGKAKSMGGSPTGQSHRRRGREQSGVDIKVKAPVGGKEVGVSEGEEEKGENLRRKPRPVL
jgi:hypothetical protein